VQTRRFVLKLAGSGFAACLLCVPWRLWAQQKPITRIVFRGANYSGDISRVSADEWLVQWAENDKPTRHSSFFDVVSQNNLELILRNRNTDERFKADLAARKMFVLQGTNWVAHSDIVSAE